jgi:hypothetical protein
LPAKGISRPPKNAGSEPTTPHASKPVLINRNQIVFDTKAEENKQEKEATVEIANPLQANDRSVIDAQESEKKRHRRHKARKLKKVLRERLNIDCLRMLSY